MANKTKQINSDVTLLKFGQVSPDLKISTPSWEEGTVRNENSYVPFGPTNRFPNELYAIIQQSLLLFLLQTKLHILLHDIYHGVH